MYYTCYFPVTIILSSKSTDLLKSVYTSWEKLWVSCIKIVELTSTWWMLPSQEEQQHPWSHRIIYDTFSMRPTQKLKLQILSNSACWITWEEKWLQLLSQDIVNQSLWQNILLQFTLLLNSVFKESEWPFRVLSLFFIWKFYPFWKVKSRVI